jgi:hypothetical protein
MIGAEAALPWCCTKRVIGSRAGPTPQPTMSSTKRKAKGRPHAKVPGAGVLTLEARLEPGPNGFKAHY